MQAASETRVTGLAWPQPEQQQEGAGRILARPDAPSLPSPALPGWLLASATLDGPLILRDLRPCTCRPPLPRERPGPAQPRRPASLHTRDVRLYSPRDTAPCGCSADPPGGRGSLRGRRPPLRVTPSHVVAAEALQLAD